MIYLSKKDLWIVALALPVSLMLLVGGGGWVDLPLPIIVRAGETFIAVPEREGRSTTTEPFEIPPEDACSTASAGLIAKLSARMNLPLS